MVGALLEEADGGAIALGGGSVLSERVREALGRHLVVWLQVDAEEAWRRIAHSDRPLARSAEDVARLLAERLPLYEELADAVVPSGDRGIVARALPSIQALARAARGDADALGRQRLRRVPGLRRRAACSAPPRVVAAGEPPLLRHRLGRGGPLRRARSSRSRPGSRSSRAKAAKTMAEAERVLRELARAGMTREDHVVALGGGVVGDLAGFCAHTYQRGVPVVQVPTTLVAQVDSAYGGKTGVDLPEGKNYVGAYHLPAAVLADTVDAGDPAARGAGGRLRRGAEDRAAGRRRALGAGARRSSASTRPTSTTSSSPAPATSARWSPPTSATPACARSSTSATRSATRSRRRAATPATATARRSGSACWRRCASPTPPSCATRSRTILRRHGLPVALDPAIDVDEVLEALQRDKKRTAEGVGFVLLSEPGEPRTGQLVDPDRVRAAVEELRRK